MAFEVKVFREITAYEARIFYGLPSRVALALALVGPPSVGLLILGYLYDLTDVLQWFLVWVWLVATALCMRVRGLTMETYLGYVRRYYQAPRIYVYSQEGRMKHEAPIKRRKDQRAKIALLEREN